GPARHRVRLPAARERDPAPALLGIGFSATKRKGRSLLRDRGKEQGLLGDETASAITTDPTIRRREIRSRRGREGHRALEWHGRLCRQGHRLPPLEVRSPRARLRLSQVLLLSQRA